ncbi:S1 family peptidase [Streptomyces poriferorum]|uniref:Serine protease n=1 Tax=Streptomyces poriferorum TaxID=2798799 RepID=A0ABY9IJN0_9ACTN|nr:MULTISPECIES: serine protease [unclassified Streptomyces]MDP5315595.1 serine protease [Streptomyces sp. Alt4]WLQ53971.1 serine protease [Streptomyces sp. Alt2]
MKKKRVVEVWAQRGEDDWGCGSGYLVSSRLVLTAAHVIVDGKLDGTRTFDELATSDDVRLGAWGFSDLFTGKVIWRGEGPDLDVALVEITDDAWAPTALPPVRWGRTTCQETKVACKATGFPQVLRLPDARREREQLSGSINPGTGEKERQYHVSVDNAPTRHSQGDRPWAGMSGAALFSGDLLIGVVVVDHAGFDGNRLTAVRMNEAFSDVDFLGLVSRYAGLQCLPGELLPSQPALESVELSGLFTRSPVALRPPRSPAALLTAQVSAVRWFRQREEYVTDLIDWLASPEPLEARLVVGPGGHGKTRLAQELVQRAGASGWITGMVDAKTADRMPAECLRGLSSCEVPILLVVDYAETRPEVVSQLLESLDIDEGPTVRLLLIARSPGQWWEKLWGTTWQLQEATALDAVTAVGPLSADISQRKEAFDEAVKDLLPALGRLHGLAPKAWTASDWVAAGEQVITPDLSLGRYGSIMQVQLAALVALLRQLPKDTAATISAPPMSASLEDYLLLRERDYWQRSATESGLDLTVDTLANAVTVATLLGAADHDEALAVLGRVRGLHDQSEDRLMAVNRWLDTLYPAPSGAGRWGALEPDRLGEYFICSQLSDQPTLLDEPLAAATPAQLHQAFHVLARAGIDSPAAQDLLKVQIVGQLGRTGLIALAVATETEEPAFLVEALEQAIQEAGDPDALAEFAQGFPAEAPALAMLAEQITRLETAVYQRLETSGQADYLPQLARATRRHAELLVGLGLETKAVAVQSEAVRMFKELAQRQREEGEER